MRYEGEHGRCEEAATSYVVPPSENALNEREGSAATTEVVRSPTASLHHWMSSRNIILL